MEDEGEKGIGNHGPWYRRDHKRQGTIKGVTSTLAAPEKERRA